MKRIFAALTLICTLFAPGLSLAEGTGLYLAPKFLMSFQNSGNMSRSSALAGSGLDNYSQFTLGGGLAGGYDFWVQNSVPLRAELEFSMRGNSETSWDTGGSRFSSAKGTWNNSTLFANFFWDFHNDTALTPYLGAGLGLAFNYTGYDFKLQNGDTVSMDDRFTNFAWNVGAGASFSVTDNLAIDASYRFMGLGYNELSTNYGGKKYEVGNDPYNNEFALGVRVSF